jgi:choline monooxygenase
MTANGLDLTELRFHGRDEWHGDANWKVMLENYLECYHCPVAHPGFSAVINVDPASYDLRVAQWFSSQCAPVRTGVKPGRGELPYDARGQVTVAQYHFLWPNLTISIHPGQVNLSMGVWLPDGPGRTRGFTDRFFGPHVSAEFIEQLQAFVHQVVAEDAALTASVQRGVEAGVPEQGRLFRKSEALIVHFQQLVTAALA